MQHRSIILRNWKYLEPTSNDSAGAMKFFGWRFQRYTTNNLYILGWRLFANAKFMKFPESSPNMPQISANVFLFCQTCSPNFLPTFWKCSKFTRLFGNPDIWPKIPKQLFVKLSPNEMKWNESGFRPPLCTYRLNWARRTSWGWWDDWDDTVIQTQDSKFEPWRSEAEHATSRSRRLPTILTFTRGWGRNNFVSFKPPRPGTEPRTLAWKAAVLTTTLGPPPKLSPNCPQKSETGE